MDSLSCSSVQLDDFVTTAEFILRSKKGDAAAAASFLRKTLAEVDGSSLDMEVLSTTVGVDFLNSSSSQSHSGIGDGLKKLEHLSFWGDEVDSNPATLVMLIPGDIHVVGHVIGKGGAEIAKIEVESGASVKIEAHSSNVPLVPQTNSESLGSGNTHERTVIISGTVVACVKAQRLLDRRLRSRLENDGIHREVLRIIVPNDFVRHLIGKGGTNITQLQSQTHIKIQVQAEASMSPNQLGRAVTFQGMEQGRSFAQYLVSRQISESPFRDWPQNVSAHSTGGTSPPPSPKVVINVQQRVPSKHHPAEKQSYSNAQDNELSAFARAVSSIGPYSGSVPGNVEYVPVSNQVATFLLGPGASHLHDIEQRSGGATLKVEPPSSNRYQYNVSIKGRPSNVAQAQALLHAKLETNFAMVHTY